MPRYGNQAPTYSWCGSYTRTEGGLASKLADAYGLPPHQWQQMILNDWLALDDRGKLLNSLCVLPVPRQNGKALSLDTEIPTPSGWRTMEDVHVGDYVFGQDGKPSRVTLESEIFDKPMYLVSFDDGSTIKASADHVWTVQTKETKRRPSAKCDSGGWYDTTTEQMAAKVFISRTDGRTEYRYRVPMNAAVEYPTADLPIHPYAFGAWLGDGTSKNASITIGVEDIEESSRIFAKCGYPLTRLKTGDRAPMFRIGKKAASRCEEGTFFKHLKSLGVVRNKHIPDVYMTASVKQRWELLRGLMDTDGYCSKAGQCEFVQKKRELCVQLLELCSSLGIKARMYEKRAKCNGVDAGIVYRVTFFTDLAHPCFNLERKRSRLKESIAYRTTFKAISNIERIPNEPSKCIAIDNDSHLYLAGRRYTATHNTGVIEPRETWGLVHRGEWILHTAHEYQTAKIGFDRLRAKFGERKNDPRAKFPELNALVKRYTISANQMILDLKNGAHIEFRTRGNNEDVGRGGTFDLVVVDEAQSYTDEQDAALSPLNSAAPKGSPQFIMTGTVPKPTSPHKGEKFATVRASLHDEPYIGACIHEWAAPEIGDVTDVSRWYEFNPSLGYQLLEAALLADSRKMNADTFAREHLGWWPESVIMSAVIRESEWAACRVDEPQKDGLLVYAVKFSADGSTGAVAACYRSETGVPFVYVVDAKSLSHGIGWFVDNLAQRASKAAQIVIDGQSNAQTLNDRLLAQGVPAKTIIRPSARDVAAACSALVNAVKERKVTHYGQPALDDSATKTKKRRIGNNGGWGFASTDEADATLIDSVALAYWGAVNTKRKPGRKAVVF